MKRQSECSRIGLELASYVSSRLDPAARKRVDEHLRSCDKCRNEAAKIRKVLDRLCEMPASAATRDLAPEIMAKIPSSAWRPQRRNIVFPLLLRAAAMLIALLAAATLVRVAFRSPPPAAKVCERQFIQSATAWLLASQEADGHWDSQKWGAQKQYTVGITALALTACAKADPSILQGSDAQAIEAGLAFLIRNQNPDGRFGPLASATPYNHGLALLALLEAFALDPRPEWKSSIDRAIAYVGQTQRESGAWGYPRESPDKGNTSITVWQVQALLRANQLGWPGVRPGIEKASAWLESMTDSTGRIGYSRPNDFPNGFETMTAAGALCMLTNRRDLESPLSSRVLAMLHKAARNSNALDYYRNYFLAQALQAEGSETSRRLLSDIERSLLANQNRQGEMLGSFEPRDRWSSAGGRVYTTAMAVLAML